VPVSADQDRGSEFRTLLDPGSSDSGSATRGLIRQGIDPPRDGVAKCHGGRANRLRESRASRVIGDASRHRELSTRRRVRAEMRTTAIGLVLILTSAISGVAFAEPERAPAAEDMGEDVVMSGGARSMANDWIIPPRGWVLGSALSYETARGGIGDHGLAFTDVAFLRLTARGVVKGRAEFYGGLDLLPKQPSFTDEPVFEGAHAGVLVRLPHHLGFDARLDEGALENGAGIYGGARAGLIGRRIVHEVLAYEGEVSASWTPLRFDQGARASLTEVTANGSIVFRAPDGIAAAWVGFGFAFPVAHSGSLPGVGALDPHVRSDVRIGAVVSFIKEWDVYAEYAVLDRGDYEAPRTMLPILDGGFDQQQLTVGIVRHFGQDKRDDDDDVPPEMNVANADE
jgi:hypothetical protein